MTDSAASFSTEMRRIFEDAADVYDQSGVEFFRPVGRRLVEIAGVSAGESVLDVACGRGAVLLPAGEAVGPRGRAVGIDVAESMLSHAAAAAADLPQVATRRMDGRRPALPAGELDAVLSSCGAMFWINGVDELRPYRELLRPGGRLALSAPSFFGIIENRVPVIPEEVAPLFTTEIARIGEAAGEMYRDNPFVHPESSWLANPERIRADLSAAGFAGVDLHEENLPITVESGQQWVRWTRSHGMRALWEQLDQQRATELATEVAARLDALRGPDGLIRLDNAVAYIRAEVPRSS